MIRYKIIYELNEPDPLRPLELYAANIVANYFRSNIVFIRKMPHTTPDLYVIKTRQSWKLKSPLSNGKRTIANNLRNASRQSKKIIIDLSRCKMNNTRAITRIHGFLKSGDAHIEKLLVIDKSGKVIDFYSK